MATRENFRITFNGQEVIKHKWNSACREVEHLIRHIAVKESQGYILLDKESIRDASGFHIVKGHRTWKGENGNIVRFDIEKVTL